MRTVPSIHELFLTCSNASTDTRNIAPGSMFFALKGPYFNANAFAAEALEKGARWAVVDDVKVATDDRFLLVDDVLTTLQQLATYHRRTFDIPVIGITGTNGKTTTKELVHTVLSADRTTLATSGNLNNHIGVPLTLLGLTSEHRIAVVEMGANKPGDIAELVNIAEPTHGLITNVGKAHLEGFGSFDGVVRTKTELYAYERSHAGHLFVNADDPLLMERSEGIARTTYGRSPWADLTGASTDNGTLLNFRFKGSGGVDRTVTTKLVGGYNLPNALAAVAIGRHFGVPDGVIARALSEYTPRNNRSQLTDTGKNQLILDAYNANPTSMAVALENFVKMGTSLPKLAIFGDMLELGDVAEAEHRRIVELAKQLGQPCWFVGPLFMAAAKLSEAPVFEDAASLLAHLADRPLNGHLLLLKASRGTKLETIVPAL